MRKVYSNQQKGQAKTLCIKKLIRELFHPSGIPRAKARGSFFLSNNLENNSNNTFPRVPSQRQPVFIPGLKALGILPWD
jgi:hypothetical protein